MNFVQCKKNIIVLRLFLLTLLQDGFVVQNRLFDRYLFRLGSPPGQRCMGIPETLKVMDGLGGGRPPPILVANPLPTRPSRIFAGTDFSTKIILQHLLCPRNFSLLGGWGD